MTNPYEPFSRRRLGPEELRNATQAGFPARQSGPIRRQDSRRFLLALQPGLQSSDRKMERS